MRDLFLFKIISYLLIVIVCEGAMKLLLYRFVIQTLLIA